VAHRAMVDVRVLNVYPMHGSMLGSCSVEACIVYYLSVYRTCGTGG
jgi:hypothetical protein